MSVADNIHSSVKMIIWDLDNTLWEGILAESDVKLSGYAFSLVKKACNCGIISSICSNNDFGSAEKVLRNMGIWEYFVFPVIGFGNKGKYISEILHKAHLRAENVLLIDDNNLNLENALFNEESLNTLHTGNLKKLEEYLNKLPANDTGHRKLEQYGIVEKRNALQHYGNNNSSFLYDMKFQVEFGIVTEENYPRILELCEKAHQLNYTRKTLSIENLRSLNKKAKLRWIRLYEKLGDNGIVGFYCVDQGRLIHFVFSCRVINTGLPQWVYTFLGCPYIEAAEDTAEPLEKKQKLEGHIKLYNQILTKSNELYVNERDRKNIYFYGSCNMHRCLSYLALPDNRIYFDSNPFVDGIRASNNSSEYLRSCYAFSEEQKLFCEKHFSNYREGYAFHLWLDKKVYDYAIFSFSDDSFMHIYVRKSDSLLRISGRGEENAPRIMISCEDGRDPEEWFASEFIDKGCIAEKDFENNLYFIRNHIPDETTIILIGEASLDQKRRGEKRSKEELYQVKMMNRIMKLFCDKPANNSFYVDMDNIITSTDDFSDYIFHWTCSTSYKTACAMFDAMSNKICFEKQAVLGEHSDKKPVLVAEGSQAEIMRKSLACNGMATDYFDIAEKTDEEIERYLKSRCKDAYFLDVTKSTRIFNATEKIEGVELYSYFLSQNGERIVLVLGSLSKYLAEENINCVNNYTFINRPIFLDGNRQHLKYGLLGTETDYIVFDLFYFLQKEEDWVGDCEQLIKCIAAKYGHNYIFLLGMACENDENTANRIRELEEYVIKNLNCNYVKDAVWVDRNKEKILTNTSKIQDVIARLCTRMNEIKDIGEFHIS